MLLHPRRDIVPVYMVERSLKGIPIEKLAAAQQRAISTAKEFRDGGKDVIYIRTTFLPDEGCCMCLFAAESLEVVRDVNEAAQIPFNRIVPALDLTPK
jgi:hypothetical protein